MTFQALSFLALAPFVAHVAGAGVLGVWSLNGAILAWASLFDFGIGEGAAQAIAAAGGRAADRRATEEIYGAAYRSLRRYALLGVLPVVGASSLLASATTPQTLNAVHVFLFWTVSLVAYLATLPSLAATSIHIGRGELWAQRAPLLVESLATAAISFGILLRLADPLLVLGLAAVAGRVFGLLARRYLLVRRVGVRSRLSNLDESKIELRGRDFLVASIGARLLLATDTLVLGLFVGVTSVGWYSFAFRCGYTAMQGIWTQSDHIFALIARLKSGGSLAQGRDALVRTLVSTNIFSGTAGIVTALAAPSLTKMLSPALAISVTFAALLAGFILVHSNLHVLAISAQACGRQRQVGQILLAGGVLNLLLSLALVGRLGPYGLLWASIIVDVVFEAPLLLTCLRREGLVK